MRIALWRAWQRQRKSLDSPSLPPVDGLVYFLLFVLYCPNFLAHALLLFICYFVIQEQNHI